MPEQTVAEIEQQFDAAIEKAKSKPDVLAQLQIEKVTAVAAARLRDVETRERALWKREALSAWPLAQEFADQVVGDTEEAVVQSAKAMHERISALFGKHQRQLEIDRIVEQHLNGNQSTGTDDNADAGATVQQP